MKKSIEKLTHKNFYMMYDNFYKRKYIMHAIEEIFMQIFARNIADIDIV